MKSYLAIAIGVVAYMCGVGLGGYADRVEAKAKLAQRDEALRVAKRNLNDSAKTLRQNEEEMNVQKQERMMDEERLSLAANKIRNLEAELSRLRKDADAFRGEKAIMEAAERDRARQVVRAKTALENMSRLREDGPLTLEQIATAKQAFNDIQQEVAAGKFKELALTNGYQRLREIFDHPELADLIREFDTVKGER